MPEKVIVLTGASDGIGAAAARQLSDAGHTVVLVGRSPDKTRAIANKLGSSWFVADFDDLDQVRALAKSLLERYARIDVLVNNAGGIMGAYQVTVDGHERTFQVNHLAPFLLTTLLLERLVQSQATVINTSSVANKAFGNLDLDDLESTISYKPTRAYGNAKLENILFAKELHRRYHARGISSASFHPGNVATNFSHESKSPFKFVYHTPLRRLLTSPSKGADTLTWLATSSPGADWPSGEYFVRRMVARANSQAYDVDLAQGLWDRSVAMLLRG